MTACNWDHCCFVYAGFEEIKENVKPVQAGGRGWTEASDGIRRTSLDPLVQVKLESETEESKNKLFYELLHEVNPNNVDNTEVIGYSLKF